MISNQVFHYLNNLQKNNDREWFAANKQQFLEADIETKLFFNEVYDALQKQDSIGKMQIFRIYRDVRFSKDKSPYKIFFSAWYSRLQPHCRGSYYIHIAPGNTFIEGGFWEPNPRDLMRIRQELAHDASQMREVIADADFKKYFNSLEGEEIKTAPRGFDKEHPEIDLLRKKQFLITRKFTDKEVTAKSFLNEVLITFKAMRPFLDYMSDVLTTNLNGENIIE